MMSIRDISRIRKPIIWTLHDMWPFCGMQHYPQDDRWKQGFSRESSNERWPGFDMDRWAWKRKHKHWQKPMHLVAPSEWMANCARQSKLMGGWPVSCIPNTIDVEQWRPVNRELAREILRLPQDQKFLLFGAEGGSIQHRKGFDLLIEAMNQLPHECETTGMIIFGQQKPKGPPPLNCTLHYFGHLNDDISLQLLYSAADALIIPSRQDNFPNTSVEAHSCGTPVVAFDVGGLSDSVVHASTGYLAQPFDSEDLAKGIQFVLDHQQQLSENARHRAVERWSYPVVAAQHRELYLQVLESNQSASEILHPIP